LWKKTLQKRATVICGQTPVGTFTGWGNLEGPKLNLGGKKKGPSNMLGVLKKQTAAARSTQWPKGGGKTQNKKASKPVVARRREARRSRGEKKGNQNPPQTPKKM